MNKHIPFLIIQFPRATPPFIFTISGGPDETPGRRRPSLHPIAILLRPTQCPVGSGQAILRSSDWHQLRCPLLHWWVLRAQK